MASTLLKSDPWEALLLSSHSMNFFRVEQAIAPENSCSRNLLAEVAWEAAFRCGEIPSLLSFLEIQGDALEILQEIKEHWCSYNLSGLADPAVDMLIPEAEMMFERSVGNFLAEVQS